MNKRREKVYIETTIPSYVVARPSRDIIVLGHQRVTKEWWHAHHARYDLYTSQIVLREIREGDKEYAAKRESLISSITILDFNDDIEKVAATYMRHYHLPDQLWNDMYHIAFASFYSMDFILTWNCKHIANAHIQQQLGNLNTKLGYRTPVLCTPEQLEY